MFQLFAVFQRFAKKISKILDFFFGIFLHSESTPLITYVSLETVNQIFSSEQALGVPYSGVPSRDTKSRFYKFGLEINFKEVLKWSNFKRRI